MRIIDLHCYPNTEPWIRCQGPYVEALAKYWNRTWTWKQEDEVVKEFTDAGVEAVLVALDLETTIATPPCSNEYVKGMQLRHPDRIIQSWAAVDPFKGEVAIRDARKAITELGMRRQITGRGRGDWIDQHLLCECDAVRMREDRKHRGQIAARAVATDRKPRRIGTELRGMRDQPAQRGLAIVDGGRKPMFGREPIIHRDHDAFAVMAQSPAGRVVDVEIAEHESTTVAVQHGAAPPGLAMGRVNPQRQFAAGAVDGEILHRHLGRRQIAIGEYLPIHLARGGWRQIAQIGCAAGGHRAQHRGQLQIKHGVLPLRSMAPPRIVGTN